VVATVNAVNFVDGLDGLAAGVVGIGALAFFVFCYQLTNLNGPPSPRPARCSAPRSPARAPASCRTTSTRPASSWATAARC
jgi:UDP-N-acetylmuramyl pentapeptide phosphotransferase/UDP-N-acetylglucosamine-1-phosphate transferase